MVAPKMKHPLNSGFTLKMFCKSDPVYKDIVSWKPFFLSSFFFFFLTSFHITCDLRNKDVRAVIIPSEYPPCWIFFISCTSYFFCLALCLTSCHAYLPAILLYLLSFCWLLFVMSSSCLTNFSSFVVATLFATYYSPFFIQTVTSQYNYHINLFWY